MKKHALATTRTRIFRQKACILACLLLLACIVLPACAPRQPQQGAGQSAGPAAKQETGQHPAVAVGERFEPAPLVPPAHSSGAQEAQRLGQMLGAHAGARLLRAGKAIELSPNMVVRPDDTLHSGPHGPMHMLLEDGGTLTLAPNSVATLTRFAKAVSSGGNEGKGKESRPLVSISAGLVRVASGSGLRLHSPHARVEMGPGIVSLRVEDKNSTVFAENADQPVLVNGGPVAQGYKLTVPLGE